MHASHVTHSSELACVVVGYLQETLSFCHAQCCFSLKHHQALLEARCPVWVIKPSSRLPWKSRSVMAYGPVSQMVSRAAEFISRSFCA